MKRWLRAAVPVAFLVAGLAAGPVVAGGAALAGPVAAKPASDVTIQGSYWEGPEGSQDACWVRVLFWETISGRDFTCVWSDGTHYGRGWWVYRL